MTPETTITGWVMAIGPALILLGALVIRWVAKDRRTLQVQLAESRLALKSLRNECAEAHSSMRTWRSDCLDALDENDRLRRRNAELEGHPSTFRPDIEAAVDQALALGAHLNAAQSRLAVVADVVPISGAVPSQRRGGDAS